MASTRAVASAAEDAALASRKPAMPHTRQPPHASEPDRNGLRRPALRRIAYPLPALSSRAARGGAARVGGMGVRGLDTEGRGF
jgi:hypothetical protein